MGLPSIPANSLKMLAATGLLYIILMGSTFFSLGVILPHMIRSLHMDWGQARLRLHLAGARRRTFQHAAGSDHPAFRRLGGRAVPASSS